MKFILIITSIFGLLLTCPAQNSLQDSFNKALKTAEENKPVISFDAHFNQKLQNVQLNWSNTNGQTIKKFVIEKSLDKQSWQEFASIDGTENYNTQFDYFQVDNQPIEGLSYYRLKQVMASGEYSFSNIVPVKSSLPEESINLFPVGDNTNELNLSFDNIIKQEQLLVVLRDIKGQEYFSKIFMNVQSNSVIVIPIETYIPKGDYLVIASSENQMYSQNVRIQ